MISTTRDSRAAHRLLYSVRKLGGVFSSALEIMWIAVVPSLFMVFYVFLICYVMVLGAALELGVLVWLIPTAFLTPVVYAWYKVLEKRYRAYFAMMTSTQTANWNTDAAIDGWLRLIRAKKRETKS